MICTICYSDFKKKTQLMRCKHFFCLDCIQTWHSCKNNLGQRPSCPICRTKFYDSDFIFTYKNINKPPLNTSNKSLKDYAVYLNTRNRTHKKRWCHLYRYVCNLIHEVNNIPPHPHSAYYDQPHLLKIIKFLKCIDHNPWFLKKYSWGRTDHQETMRKNFVNILKDKLYIWREKGFLFANTFIFKFRPHFLH